MTDRLPPSFEPGFNVILITGPRYKSRCRARTSNGFGRDKHTHTATGCDNAVSSFLCLLRSHLSRCSPLGIVRGIRQGNYILYNLQKLVTLIIHYFKPCETRDKFARVFDFLKSFVWTFLTDSPVAKSVIGITRFSSRRERLIYIYRKRISWGVLFGRIGHRGTFESS